MKISIKNLGAIKQAEFTLGGLTIICGGNNTGKKKTRITRCASCHDTPERAMKVDWPNNIQFNQLAGLGA